MKEEAGWHVSPFQFLTCHVYSNLALFMLSSYSVLLKILIYFFVCLFCWHLLLRFILLIVPTPLIVLCNSS